MIFEKNPPSISTTTNAKHLKPSELLGISFKVLKISSLHSIFYLVTMATTQSLSASLPFDDETLLNTDASRIYNYQAKIVKLCEMISLSLRVSKI